MKLINIFLVLISISTPCLGEIFYYGDHFLNVDLRSDQSSILKFDGVPLSSACQPGVLRFEPLDPKTLNIGETQQVQENNSSEKDSSLSQLLRVTPQEKTGIITCSFTLSGGFEVPIRFNLTDTIARPFLDFRPIENKFSSTKVTTDLSLLQSLLKGDSIYLHDVTKEFENCSFVESKFKECKPLKHSTEIADYKLVYAGTDTATSAWTLSLITKVDINFSKIADLKVIRGGNILYSVLTPQNKHYTKGTNLKHFILTGAKVTQLDILEALP